MHAKLTLAERICSSFWFGIVALISLSSALASIGFLMATPARVLASFFFGGCCAVFFVPAAILNPNEFSTNRALATGALTTFCSAILIAIAIGILSENSKVWYSNDPGKILLEDIKVTLILILSGSILSIPFSVIGVAAASLFFHMVTKRRKKLAPEIDPDVFE
ncbi:hypothetical protein WH95_01780 [Kiloniella litopenaei]|uniref:Uncharacterized protein n=1 Tax=Kiloniella litopenaei TaxID=1549748 RepID=A0A0M2REV6_9PROT|nr:hypothetical protein [Kiloniella litopenaei]KKJ78108.1 hypothetical protein WH95_01780 [Kiloniella litopenaei]